MENNDYTAEKLYDVIKTIYLSQNMTADECKECFGYDNLMPILMTHTYQELINEYDAWASKFRPGDEVVIKDKCVRGMVIGDGYGDIIVLARCNENLVEAYKESQIRKTGYHYNEFDDLVKRLGERY